MWICTFSDFCINIIFLWILIKSFGSGCGLHSQHQITIFYLYVITSLTLPQHYICRLLYPQRYKKYLMRYSSENTVKEKEPKETTVSEDLYKYIMRLSGLWGVFLFGVIFPYLLLKYGDIYYKSLGVAQIFLTYGAFFITKFFPKHFFYEYKVDQEDTGFKMILKGLASELKAIKDARN